MANEFVVKNGLIVSSGSVKITGSVTVTQTLTANSIVGAISASNGIVSGSSQIISILSSLNSHTASINNWSSSLATTGSNQFNGSQTITGSVTATSFVGNGSGLTNLSVDISTAQLNDVDGNNIPVRSFAELFVACAIAEIVDLDFN